MKQSKYERFSIRARKGAAVSTPSGSEVTFTPLAPYNPAAVVPPQRPSQPSSRLMRLPG